MSLAIVSVELTFFMSAPAAGTVALLNVFVFSFCAVVSTVAYTFAVKDPVVNVLPIPQVFLLPPQARKKEDLMRLKNLCDRFYKNPKITFDNIQNAHIHSIYLINTDKGFSKELDPEAYLQMTKDIIDRSEIDI